jgi:hypothetical protein
MLGLQFGLGIWASSRNFSSGIEQMIFAEPAREIKAKRLISGHPDGNGF